MLPDLVAYFWRQSDMRLGLAWTAAVAMLGLLLVIDFWSQEPCRKVDVLFLGIGALALFNAAHNEAKGRYAAKVRIVERDREPEKFRRQTIMLVVVGGLFVTAGAILQLGGWAALMFP